MGVLRFSCPVCSAEVFFDDRSCASCGSELVFDRGSASFQRREDRYRCDNAALIGCPWLAPGPIDLCEACALTRTRPPADNAAATEHWALAERAKRHVVVELDRLGLRLRPQRSEGDGGLAIDMHWSDDGSVTIGHARGVITLDAAEADDVRRAEVQSQMAEPYRTMLGHLRHELGHYWWASLTGGSEDEHESPSGTSFQLDRFREAFGDERADYQASIDRHYAEGPPEGWEERYVSSYATMHPWEDWAECFAHYLHLRDSLDTAAAFGLTVTYPNLGGGVMVHATASADDRTVSIEQLLHQWSTLTIAINALNRSMDLPDLYPFVLNDAVRAKLALVHDLVLAGPVR